MITEKETELFLKGVGFKIKAIRQKKKISQRELSEMCGLTYLCICRIEAGQKDTDILTIYNIADKLEVSPKDFFEPLDAYTI